MRAHESVKMFIPSRLSECGRRRKPETKYTETQPWQNKDRDKERMQTSPVTTADRLPRNYRDHFQEEQLGLCNWWHCKPGMAPEMGGLWESRAVQIQKQCAGKWRSRMNKLGLDREGYKRSQSHVKYGQSVHICLAQPCTWSSQPVLSSCIFLLHIFLSIAA